ncbi:zinc transporter ZupT [Fusobacterium sp.]|uniref:zinc transporter ZupT n=1 Tax=Fusobacterium sp. TaxID=68766 RepID=UPI00396C5B52
METDNFMIAFILTLLAGLAMGVGGLLGFISNKKNRNFYAGSVGFAAGVMLYAAFVEILPESMESLEEMFPGGKGNLIASGAFFGGIIFMLIIEKFCLPHNHHGHHHGEDEDHSENEVEVRNRSMYRMGIMTAIAIAIHNFPEGFAIFTSALKDPKLGISVAIAIAIHNVAVGIAVSAPIYYGTGNKKKAFGAALLSGLSEPAGALLGYWVLYKYLDDGVFGFVLAIVAGIMVYISLDELIPSAQDSDNHIGTYSLVAGMFVMAMTLIFI